MDKVYKEIIIEGKLYASILDPTLAKEGLDFLTEDSSFLQVGTWNYKKGHKLEPIITMHLVENPQLFVKGFLL